MKLFRYLLLAVAALSLHSCDGITGDVHINEEICLDEKGSGEYKIYADMVQVMRSERASRPYLGTESIEEELWREFPSGEVDSSFNFAKIMFGGMSQRPSPCVQVHRDNRMLPFEFDK